MPKVLRILNRLIVGGPLLNAAYLTRYLSPEFETQLVVGQKEDHEKEADFVLEELGIQPIFVPEMERAINFLQDYRAYQKMKAIIRDFKPDIVHTHAAKPGMIGRMAAKALKVPVIVHTYHGHVFHSYFGNFKTKAIINAERYMARKSDAIIAISELQKKELAHEFKIDSPEKFRVIPLGLDLDKFQLNTEEKRIRFRKEFGVGEGEVVITIIGRLVPVKNHILFLEALHHILQNTSKRIKAFIVGDGETRRELEMKAEELEIKYSSEKSFRHPHPLVFTSWRHDVDVINAGSDIIALTSLNEGTPVSLIEAQAAGKPIVATKVGGVADVVLEAETALLSDVNDTGGFCKNLLQLVEDENLRIKLGGKGSAHVMQQYSYHRLVKDMSALYYELLKKKK
jgi:glycosyltransferase involved in cell wall biosynthesis